MPVDRDTYSRLFIIGGKGLCKEDYKQAFGKYGKVTDVFLTKVRASNEFNGNVYLTFEKASEAVLAMEEMNGKTIGDHPKQIKVLLAAPKGEWSVLGHREAYKLQRLFIVVPVSYTEEDIIEKFKVFGDIEFARVITNKATGKSKGLAFVKFYRAYHAALALEGCDSAFKAVYASNRLDRQQEPNKFSSAGAGGGGGGGGGFVGPVSPQTNGRTVQVPGSYAMDIVQQPQGQGPCRLEVMAPNMVSNEQLRRIFDIVPGLESCDLDTFTGVTYVSYQTPRSAAHALEKLDGFEYPPGYRLSVKYPGIGCGLSSSAPGVATDRSQSGANPLVDNLSTLVDSIQKATAVLQQAGISNPFAPASANPPQSNAFSLPPGGSGESLIRVNYTNVMLPEKKPMLARDTTPQRRLFIVSTPHCFQDSVLEDAFCRFGSLISACFIPGKTFAFAKYGDGNCAQRAMDTLHGQQMCGATIKVLEGAPRKSEMNYKSESEESPRKRPHDDI